jgi:hypothetical protein
MLSPHLPGPLQHHAVGSAGLTAGDILGTRLCEPLHILRVLLQPETIEAHADVCRRAMQVT